MKIIFLGTSGWYDNSAGNTICTLIDCKEGYIILDAGFGLAKADKYITEEKPVYLFLGHIHIDHICGLHTLPKFNFKQGLNLIYEDKNHKYLKNYLNHPFAAPLSHLHYKVKIKKIKPGKYSTPFNFEAKRIRHIDLALGYRFNLEGKIITYCSDTAPCVNSVALAQNADLLIHECAGGKEDNIKWGHSSPEGAAGIALKAEAKKLVLTHFDASTYGTAQSRRLALKCAQQYFKNTINLQCR